jgi:hypothetical protein
VFSATEHRTGAREITKILVGLPLEEEVSPELGWLASSGLVTIAQGQPESLWVEMDGGRRGGKVVVPSKAPLTLVW